MRIWPLLTSPLSSVVGELSQVKSEEISRTISKCEWLNYAGYLQCYSGIACGAEIITVGESIALHAEQASTVSKKLTSNQMRTDWAWVIYLI